MSARALLHAPTSARRGEVVEIRALIAHAMETGHRRDGEGRLLPRDLVRTLQAHFDGELVFAAELHAAVAANPYVAFHLRLPASGTLTVRWAGDRGFAHAESVRIEAT